MKWFSDALRWVFAGALIGFGIVGLFTGLILVPFGVAAATWLGVNRADGSGLLLVGIGSGAVVLLYDDVTRPGAYQPTGAVPGFWIGVGLMILGSALAAIQLLTSIRSQAR